MKKLCLVLLVLASLPVLAAGQVVEEIIARVNNQIVTRSEFVRSKDQLKDEVKQQDAANADKLYGAREKDILRDLIDQQLLLEKGKDLGITGDTDLIKRLDQMRKDMKLESMEALEKAATPGPWEDATVRPGVSGKADKPGAADPDPNRTHLAAEVEPVQALDDRLGIESQLMCQGRA